MEQFHLLSTAEGWIGTLWSRQGLLALSFPRPTREEARVAVKEVLPAAGRRFRKNPGIDPRPGEGCCPSQSDQVSESDAEYGSEGTTDGHPEGTETSHRLIIERSVALLAGGLERYFQGRPVSFLNIAVDLSPYPLFFARVLEFVRHIGYGQLWSYGQVAAAVGRPGAARAVGNALAANLVPLVIPCHRVIARDGSLGGFGGGLPLKRRLLELEGCRPDPAGRYSLKRE